MGLSQAGPPPRAPESRTFHRLPTPPHQTNPKPHPPEPGSIPSPRVISPLPPAPHLLYPHTLLSPPSFPPSQHENAESAPIACPNPAPRDPNPPRETKQSTIVPAPYKQSTPKPISLIDPSPPPTRHSCGGRNPSLLNAHPPPTSSSPPHPPTRHSCGGRNPSLLNAHPPPPPTPLVIPAPDPASLPPPTPIQVLNLFLFHPLFPFTYSVILSPDAFGRISTLHPTHGPRHHGPQDTAIARRFVRPIRLSTGLAGP